MKRSRRLVTYVVEDEKSPQFQYRVANVIQSLEKSQNWQATYVKLSELDKIDFDNSRIIIIVRQTAKDRRLLDMIDRARIHGVKVLFDIDDLVFDYCDLMTVWRTVKEKNPLYWMGYFWGIRRIAKRVDGFIVTNDYLGRMVKRSFDKPYCVVHNSLSEMQVKWSEDILGGDVAGTKKQNERKKFIIGYFSGSPTHEKDLAVAESGLVRFLRSHSDASLQIVGEMNLSSELKKLKEVGKIELRSRVDMRRLLELEGAVTVNIAPLLINDFTNCKSELKFFEAGIVETITLASPSFAFKEAIQDGKNGILVNDGEWFERLELLYGDPDRITVMMRNARRTALKNYYGEKILNEIEKAYGRF